MKKKILLSLALFVSLGCASVTCYSQDAAMNYFSELVQGPVANVPEWTVFVDTLNGLIKNQPRYRALHQDLSTIRNKKGWFGKIAILRVFKRHMSLLPNDLQNKINNMSPAELASRVKN